MAREGAAARCRSSGAGACGARATAARSRPTAMRRWARTTSPRASMAARPASTIASTPETLVGFSLGGAGTKYNLANGLGGGRRRCSRPASTAAIISAPAYIAGALAYGWQDVTTDRIALLNSYRANFDANAISGRLEARLALRLRHQRPHAVCRGPVHDLLPAGLRRAGRRRREHLRALLCREGRHRLTQRARPARRHLVRSARRRSSRCAAAPPGRTTSTPTAASARSSRRCRRRLRRERRGAGARRRAGVAPAPKRDG